MLFVKVFVKKLFLLEIKFSKPRFKSKKWFGNGFLIFALCILKFERKFHLLVLIFLFSRHQALRFVGLCYLSFHLARHAFCKVRQNEHLLFFNSFMRSVYSCNIRSSCKKFINSNKAL